MLNQRGAMQAVSKVAAPDKSNSSDMACFTPGQQLGARSSWYVEHSYLTGQGKTLKTTVQWHSRLEPLRGAMCCDLFSLLVESCNQPLFPLLLFVSTACLVWKMSENSDISQEPKVASSSGLFCPTSGSKPLFYFAWLNKALLGQKYRHTHYWMPTTKLPLLHFQIVCCISLIGVRQMARVDNISLNLAGIDVACVGDGSVAPLSSQHHQAQLGSCP